MRTESDDLLLEQARTIYDAIRLLRSWITARQVCRTAKRGQRSPCHELTAPQMNTLIAIRTRGQVTIKELANALHVSAPSASTMVDRLVEMGLLTREQSRVDRRAVVVRITPTVGRSLERAEKDFLQSLTELLRRVGPEYATKWCDVYGRVRDVLKDENTSKSVRP